MISPFHGLGRFLLALVALAALADISLHAQSESEGMAASTAQKNQKRKGRKGGAAAVTKEGKPAEPNPARPRRNCCNVCRRNSTTVFATPQQANYPVYVAASPEGRSMYERWLGYAARARRWFVCGTRMGRTREVKVFATVDSPRVWDRSASAVPRAFIDRDGDGVSDEQRVW
jgi:hypothetical protein